MAAKPHILVDLNVIIDVVQIRQPFYKDSAALLDAVVRKKADGWLAAHSLTTLFYIIGRYHNRAAAATILTTLLQSFTVAPVDDAVIRKALSWGWTDFEDAVQMAAADAVKTDYLITRNLADFQSGPIPVIQPTTFLALLK
ncbi:MAG: PIN domain-containing protein [Candidatus Promineifilaceae bacterium]